MPRDTIEAVTDDGEVPFTVQVGWDPAGKVQIGVETPNRLDVFWLLTGMSITTGGTAEEHEQRATRIGGWLRSAFEKAGVNLAPNVDDADPAPLTDAQVARLVVNTLGDACQHPSSLWADLDRQRCQRLIRLLRKARDAAYGADA